MRDREEEAKKGDAETESEPEPGPPTKPSELSRKVSPFESKKAEGDADNPLICRGVD